MKKMILLCLFLFVASVGYSQENNTGGYQEMNTPSVEMAAPKDTVLDLNMSSSWVEKESVMFKYQNSYNMPNYMYRNPLGYLNVQTGMLNPYLYYSMSGSSEVWPGITTINNASFNLHYAQDRFMLTAGSDLWKYDNLGKSFVDATLHADASYLLLPWLTVGLYGQYSLMSTQNVKYGSALPSPMVPVTNFGAYARAMFNETFGIEGSVGREYNPIRGKWMPTYSFGPVIEFKKKKR